MSDLGASGTMTSSDRKKDAAAFLKVLEEDEEPAELTILGEAIEAAKKAFEDLLHRYGMDSRCYRFSAKVEFRDVTFTKNLGKLTYEDLS